ncbi:hypothetical protein P8S54_09920 [Thiomicrospira sp. R3]|nr:hypothetical protein [Thiomicrospira sp. R3]WFE68513.1 hypothetical protein P8S54_09920 [Thiomicrospira sp. R3]
MKAGEVSIIDASVIQAKNNRLASVDCVKAQGMPVSKKQDMRTK